MLQSKPIEKKTTCIFHYCLQDLLPSCHSLALNTTLGTLSSLKCENGQPLLIQQEQFTSTELAILLPLLELFPYYCPYEVLYASFYGDGKTTEISIAHARAHLAVAQEKSVWEDEMRPIRCAVSRARLKLRSLGIEISSILAAGYILVTTTEKQR